MPIYPVAASTRQTAYTKTPEVVEAAAKFNKLYTLTRARHWAYQCLSTIIEIILNRAICISGLLASVHDYIAQATSTGIQVEL